MFWLVRGPVQADDGQLDLTLQRVCASMCPYPDHTPTGCISTVLKEVCYCYFFMCKCVSKSFIPTRLLLRGDFRLLVQCEKGFCQNCTEASVYGQSLGTFYEPNFKSSVKVLMFIIGIKLSIKFYSSTVSSLMQLLHLQYCSFTVWVQTWLSGSALQNRARLPLDFFKHCQAII